MEHGIECSKVLLLHGAFHVTKWVLNTAGPGTDHSTVPGPDEAAYNIFVDKINAGITWSDVKAFKFTDGGPADACGAGLWPVSSRQVAMTPAVKALQDRMITGTPASVEVVAVPVGRVRRFFR